MQLKIQSLTFLLWHPVWNAFPTQWWILAPLKLKAKNKLFHKLLLIMVLYHSSLTITNTEAKKKSYLTLKRWHNTIKFLQTLHRNDIQEAPKHRTAFPSTLPTFPILTHINSYEINSQTDKLLGKEAGMITGMHIVLALSRLRQVTVLSSRPAQATERKLCQTNKSTNNPL